MINLTAGEDGKKDAASHYFSALASEALNRIETEATTRGQSTIDSRHVMLGILSHARSIASLLLYDFGVDYQRFSEAVSREPSIQDDPRSLYDIITVSAAAARRSGALVAVDTAHLLFGVVSIPDNAACLLLARIGVSAVEIADYLRTNLFEDESGGKTMDGKDNMAHADDEIDHLDAYQEFTKSTAMYPGAGTGSYEAMTYVALKGAGECGEFVEKLGKYMRSAGSIEAISRDKLTDDQRLDLVKELGDRLWYIASAATELGVPLSEVARVNKSKLTSRKLRNVIDGSGDNR